MNAQLHKKTLVDIQKVHNALHWMVEPGQVVEIRALEAKVGTDYQPATYSGYFNDHHKLVSALQAIRSAMGIYITLQPCHPDLLDRAENKIKRAGKDSTTADKYITRYRWLLIDCDPERVTSISSNDDEHTYALNYAAKVRNDLSNLGWPLPIEADSGNGAHLLYRIDLTVSDAPLVQHVLQGLATLYNTKDIKIDQTVFNSARICKLYGTLACKGDDTTRRPHRMSSILHVPDSLQVVSKEQLEAIAAPEQPRTPAPAYKPANQSYAPKTSSLDWLIAFFQRHDIAYKDTGDGKFILTGGCVFDPTHTNKDAAIVMHGETLGYNCFHDACSQKTWHDFRLHYEPNAYSTKPAQGKKGKINKFDEMSMEEMSAEVKKQTALDLLTEIAGRAKYIQTPGGDLFARVPVNGHHETVSINEKGSGFRRWLVYCFDNQHGYIPNSEALTQIMERIKAKASYEGEQAKVYTRIAEKDGCVYLDMGDDKWQCIKISPTGWQVITSPPVYFRRPNGMTALPYPREEGNLKDLRRIINVKTDKDFVLIVGWLLGTLHPTGPYAALNLNGERGSGKSKAETYLRSIVDPNEAPTRNAPRDEREAAITAQNNMIIALDNLSTIPLWLSDVLCRIATGSGFSTRALYEDETEKIFNSKRPIILNGIEDGIISQGDLLSRTILVTLEPPNIYITEEEIEQRFQDLHPFLLGALLDAACMSLRNRKKIRLENAPRMVDFAQWVTAAEPALRWKKGAFMQAFAENQENAKSIITDSSPVAKAIMQFMALEEHKNGYYGLISELHEELQNFEVYKGKRAPKDAARLGGQIKRIAASLRAQGLNIQTGLRTTKGSFVTISFMATNSSGNVGNDAENVGNDAENVGNDAENVGKKELLTCPSDFDIEPDETENDLFYVGDVGNQASLSVLLSSANFLEKERNGIETDRVGKIPTLVTSPTYSEEF